MNRSQLVLLSLPCILAISVFLPIVSIPIWGSISYFMNGKGDGRYILILAGIAAVMSFTRFVKWVCIPGLVSLIITIMFYFNFSRGTSFQTPDTSDGTFSELASAFTRGISLSYGFIIMALASIGLTFLPPWLVGREVRS